MSDRLDAALAYGNLGWRVMPVHSIVDGACTCFAGPRCTQPGKHPAWKDWVEKATVDSIAIRNAWDERDWNVGIATGTASGLFVLDVDVKGDGAASLRDHIARVGGEMPKVPVALTGGGGWHYFFRASAPMGNRVGLLPGVDLRADGGQVVAAPSMHASGKAYQWATGRSPSQVPLDAPPKWLLDLLTPPAAVIRGQGNSYWRALFEKGVSEGGRNDSIARIAGHLMRRRVDPVLALEVCRLWNAARCRPPLPAEEVDNTVNSISSKEIDRITKRRERGK